MIFKVLFGDKRVKLKLTQIIQVCIVKTGTVYVTLSFYGFPLCKIYKGVYDAEIYVGVVNVNVEAIA